MINTVLFSPEYPAQARDCYLTPTGFANDSILDAIFRFFFIAAGEGACVCMGAASSFGFVFSAGGNK